VEVVALMATLAAAVTVTAPDRTTVIERSELTRWTKASERQSAALDVLIRSAWFEGEARELGLVVTAKQVRDRLRAEVDETPRNLTRQDLVTYMRGQLAAEAIRERIGTAAAQSVTPAQIDAYVQAHPRTEPEQRTVRLVQATSERNARRAAAALKRGATWRFIARRYSDGEPTGRRRDVTRDMLPTRVGQAAFEAKQGRLLRVGRYVVKVVAIEPEHPTPLKTQQAAAWEILASEAQQNALTADETALITKWRPRTICAPDLAAHRDCGTTGTVGGPETG
jgi:hypothetical protein